MALLVISLFLTELLAWPGGFEKFLSNNSSSRQINIMTSTEEEANDAMKAKKELIEQRMKDRQHGRDTER